VTHGSAIVAVRVARVRYWAFCKTGMTNAPWPVTTRNGASLRPQSHPEISIAWSAAGTR
jgi:hypothetical protein